MKKIIVSEEQIQQIKELYKDGLGLATISEKLNLGNKNIIRNVLKELNLLWDNSVYPRNKLKLSEEQMQEIRKLYDIGNGITDISNKLNLSHDIISRVLKELNLPMENRIYDMKKRKKKGKTKLSEKQIQDITELFNNGIVYETISTQLNIGSSLVKRTLKELNIWKDYIGPRNKTILSDEQIRHIKELYYAENGYFQISKKLNLSTTVIKRILEELNLTIDKREYPKNKTILSEEQLKEIKELYDLGDGCKTIAKKINLSTPVIGRILEELNLPVGNNRLFLRNKTLLGVGKELSEDQLKQIQYYFNECWGRWRICDKMDIGIHMLYKGMDQLNIVYNVQTVFPTQRECEKCLITFPIANFTKRILHSGRIEFAFTCIKCIEKIWDDKPKNRKTRQEYNQKYYSTDKGKENRRQYRYNNKLRRSISGSVLRALKNMNSSKSGESCLDFFPFTMNELKAHMESLFEPWMNWDNYGQYIPNKWDDNDTTTWIWQLDHIKPHSLFEYSSMEDQSFRDCWSLSNLRPYSAKRNIIDGSTRVRHKESNDE